MSSECAVTMETVQTMYRWQVAIVNVQAVASLCVSYYVTETAILEDIQEYKTLNREVSLALCVCVCVSAGLHTK